jgi:hypothetical protein
MERTPASLYDERLKRTMDAVQCKVPDRVPTLVDFGYFAAKYGGITVQDAFYDSAKWAAAWKKTVLDFQPDVFYGLMFISGTGYESVGTKVTKWPGHGVSSNQSMQAVEVELMKADEYDDLLDDPSDFIIRKVLPRGATNLEPFQTLPPLSMLGSAVSGLLPPNVATPGVVAACKAMYGAAKANMEWFLGARFAFLKEMEDLGFPAVYQFGVANNAFETIAISLRGMKGSMLDMYRQPDKLLEAIKRLSKIGLKTASFFRPMGRNTLCFMAALRGADGFMSKEQFEKFYWPFMKQTLIATVNAGFTPAMLWEGDFTSRLEYFLDLPEGKIIHRFDKTDPIKAREVLGPRHCIAGGISASLLATGTVDDVKERCKKLIDGAGKNGAYIMSHGCQMDDLKPENMKAMIDFTREYGVYR